MPDTDTVTVSIPFTYECEVRRPRKRNYVKERFGAFAAIEIPSVDAEDAPVAVVRSEGWEGEEQKQTLTRWFDGAFWETLRGGVDKALLSEMSRSNPLIGHDYEGECAMRFLAGQYQGVPEDFDHHPSSNTRVDVKANLLSHAQELIVVDAQIWRQVGEPVLKLEQHFSFGTDTVRIVADRAPESDRKDVGGYQNFFFRADRMADAQAYADVLSRLFSPRTGQWYSKVRMEALMPEVLSWRDEANDLYVGAGFIVRSFKDFDGATTQRQEDWTSLHEAWTRHGEELADESAAALMDALEDFMDHHEGRQDYVANMFHAMCRRYEISQGTFDPGPETPGRRM